jgi:nitrogen regulatory protein PII
MHTVLRRKVDILVDQPLARKVARILDAAGVGGYTVFASLGGRGSQGSWWHDQISDAQAKVMITAVMSEEKAEKVVDALSPKLNDYGLVLFLADVQVIRGERY